MAVNYGNKVFWAWNGKMEESEIRSQIRGFSEQKVEGFFIHSRCGLSTPYMSQEWFKAMQIAIEEAKERGLEVWLYDEDGWPSGFAGGAVVALNPSLAIQRMKCVCFLSQSEEPYPPAAKCEYMPKREIPPGCELVAAFRKDGEEFCDCALSEAEFAFLAQRDCRYVDLLNPIATRTFIQCTHEQYKKHFGKYFGNTIRGIFTDEPQMDGYVSYSPSLCEVYEKTYRRPFAADLKYLLYGNDIEYQKFRLRYTLVLVQQFVRSYVDILEEWCKDNNLLLVGHFPAEDGLLYQGEIAGSCGYAYTHMRYPGIDYLGRRITSDVLLKTISSAKNFTGVPRTISETFGCCGWDTTFGQYAWIWGNQASAGINSACLHFSAYSITGNRKRDYPAFFSEQEPWYSQFHYLNDWMRSVNEFISGEDIGEKILVISPFYAATCAKEEKARAISNEYRVLVESLGDLQVQFDLADELTLKEWGRADGGRIQLGKNTYRFAIVPYCGSLLKSTADLLLAFKKSGGNVLYACRTPLLAEYEEYAPLAELNRLMSGLPFGGVVQNRVELWKKALCHAGYQSEFYCIAPYGAEQVIQNVRMRAVAHNGEARIFLTNKSAAETQTFYLATGQEGVFQRKLFPSGTEEVQCEGEGQTFAKVVLPPMASDAYIFGKGRRLKPPAFAGCNRAAVVSSQLNAPNALTVDRCSYSLDGGAFSPMGDVLHIQEKIFQFSQTLSSSKNLRVRYEIHSECDISAEIYAENRDVNKVYWNGKQTCFQEKFYLDKGIRAIAARDIRKGKNELVLEYLLEPSKIDFNPNQVFESERNRFSYEKEIEAVYICGNFGLKQGGNLQRKANFWSTGGNFVITEPHLLDFSADLTPQGLYFYAGSFSKEFEIVTKSKYAKLKMEGMNAACAEIFVNGSACGCLFSEQDALDLSNYLLEGKNSIQAVYYSGLRNLLGPHHHYLGKVNFTGQNTFLGQRGWEDEIIDYSRRKTPYTEEYSFIPFSSGDAMLYYYDK